MNRDELARAIYDVSHLTGTFTLRSGAVSNEYFDKYRFESDPALLREIAEALAPLVPDGTEALAGLELGGVPLATALSQVTGHPGVLRPQGGEDVRHVPARRGRRRRGRRLTVVEDVVTSGGQVVTSCGDLRERGAVVEHALCVIDREAGGRRRPRRARRGAAPRSSRCRSSTPPRAEPSPSSVSDPTGRAVPSAGARPRAGSGSPRQGGVRGASKSTGRTSPLIAANAVSTQRAPPASGQGSSSREKNPTWRVSSGWPRSSPPRTRQWNTIEYIGQAREAEAQPVEHRDERHDLDLDARLLVDLLDGHLGGRVADVGPPDGVQPHARVGPLGQQDLARGRCRRSRRPRPSG